MTSILTNIGAMSALQTLRSISGQLENTQNQVSTGMRVGTASDNAAYWSIATTMRSDNGALSAVQDALGLGAAKVDTAYAGMESVVDIISEMKAKIVAASESGVDRAKIQEEIEQLKDQISSVVSSASFGGVNWLSTDARDANVNQSSVVASVSRTASGAFGVKSIGVDLNSIALFNSAGDGLLENSTFLSNDFGGLANVSAPTNIIKFTGPFIPEREDVVQFDVWDGTETRTATIDGEYWDDYSAYLGESIESKNDFSLFVIYAIWTAGFPQGVTGGWNSWNDQHDFNFGSTPAIMSNFRVVSTGAPSSIMDVDVTYREDLTRLLMKVDNWHEKTVSAAANLGALSSRISMQEDFVGRLTDSLDRGVGRLVDADMNEASTRLKALQTKQQLAVQSLSIANNDAQNIMTLFR